jgi:hypothetical protein
MRTRPWPWVAGVAIVGIIVIVVVIASRPAPGVSNGPSPSATVGPSSGTSSGGSPGSSGASTAPGASATAGQGGSPGANGSGSPAGATATPTPTGTPPGGVDRQPSFPIRAAFYYPWFPEAWKQQGMDPFTKYHPSLGFYDSGSATTIGAHIAAMQYGRIQVGINSWWGQGSRTDARVASLLAATGGGTFRWAVYYEAEGSSNPSVQQISSDLAYLAKRYGANPAYLRVRGRFVVFVYGDPGDGCGMADRWTQANTVHAYIVLKVFSGYKACAHQPDSWHQYAPAGADSNQAGFSYSISPGFNKANEAAARLVRDTTRWAASVRAMVASHEPWQLITTFNEWGEGTSVESATEWQSASGHGAYLDALHSNGA